jgi:hypothetical protein
MTGTVWGIYGSMRSSSGVRPENEINKRVSI